MTISNIEIIQILQTAGGIVPLTGGPSSALKPTIAQTMPFELTSLDPASALQTQTMSLTAIYIGINQLITNINFVSGTTPASSPINWWYALYDDGRGTTTANQLALLGQTADQGSAAFAANTNMGLSLIKPYTTTYSGIYYVGFMMNVSTALCSLLANTSGGPNINIYGNNIISGLAGSGLTTTAPNPSGTIAASYMFYAYVS